MSMVLNLEVAVGIGIQEIESSLLNIRHTDLSKKNNGFDVFLPDTNVNMSVKGNLDDNSILTEDLENEDWKVGYRIYFVIDSSIENPYDDIKNFIINLSNNTSYEFVLSYQYESIYAQRKSGVLTFSKIFFPDQKENLA